MTHIASLPANTDEWFWQLLMMVSYVILLISVIYCNPFPAKPFYGSHQLDLVMIWPPGIDNGAFVVSPDTVWYARVLLLFSASTMTDTGSKSFDCALVSTLETYNNPENGHYVPYFAYFHYAYYTYYTNYYLHCSMVKVNWFSNCIRA